PLSLHDVLPIATAAAGDREGIDHVAEVSDPRRADGRHPTVGGCRDRAAITDLTKRGEPGVLLVEQHIGFALEYAQRYYILESGRITSSGTGGSASEADVRAAMAI